MTCLKHLPVVIIGGGPVGLAAAAHLLARGLPVKLYEAGETVGANLRDWGHVRLFSPWEYNVDPAASALLSRSGWKMSAADHLPTGAELYADYLAPLAATPEMAAVLETGTRVMAISRLGIDKVVSRDRDQTPFVLALETSAGVRRELARAVIDASGTWSQPNPLGAEGLPADGEIEHAANIAYGIPDVLGKNRTRYAGKTTLVVGAGHSAADTLLDLATLAETERGTSILWATRSTTLARVFGGGDEDQLPARAELGSDIKRLASSGRVTLTSAFSIAAVRDVDGRLMIHGTLSGEPHVLGPVDRIVVATGQRPDLSLTRELRLEIDPWLESARTLGPLIDPNLHSCGSVPPHGHRELSHPEPGFYTVGIKSYGRAPTFLLRTGYEQVRSVVAALAGDVAAADAVELVLPDTGVCVTRPSRDDDVAGCCGGPAPVEVEACCVADVEAKAGGKSGCGCRAAA